MRRLRTVHILCLISIIPFSVEISLAETSDVSEDKRAISETAFAASQIAENESHSGEGRLKKYGRFKNLRKSMRTVEAPSELKNLRKSMRTVEAPSELKNLRKSMRIVEAPSELPSTLNGEKLKSIKGLNLIRAEFDEMGTNTIAAANGKDVFKGDGNESLENLTKDQRLSTRGGGSFYNDDGDDLDEDSDCGGGCSTPMGRSYSRHDMDDRDDQGYDPHYCGMCESVHSVSMMNDWDGWELHRKFVDPISSDHYNVNFKRLAQYDKDTIEKKLRKQFGSRATIDVEKHGNSILFKITDHSSDFDDQGSERDRWVQSVTQVSGRPGRSMSRTSGSPGRSGRRISSGSSGSSGGFRSGSSTPQRGRPGKLVKSSSSAGDLKIYDGKGMHSFIDPTDLFQTMNELNQDPSVLYVTFACEPMVGKYFCKAQCVARGDGMTGDCSTGFCQCVGRDEKKMRKKIGKQFRSVMSGFALDCQNQSHKCRRFCKNLTPIKREFFGQCIGNTCKCVTNPVSPEKDKRYVCAKAIRKLQKLENVVLRTLGYKAVDVPIKYGAPNEETENIVRKMHESDEFKGCTQEEIRNLRQVINRLSNAMSTLQSSGSATPTA